MTDFIIYTDGSCLSNPGGKGAWAYLVYQDSLLKRGNCCGYYKTTNNRMEMMAIIKAIESCPVGSSLLIYSDSQYAIKSFSIWLYSWKKSNFKNGTVKNLDLIHDYIRLSKDHSIRFSFVRGHNGNTYNELCDAEANNTASNGPWMHDIIYEKSVDNNF